ncbi:MAG: thermosome subunit [Candidatus Aenigmarchaeota archaeon]|nr:thermosome subunit [Candidatus Aenigmarchaeota archaeon]NIP39947.1 thermosome subunit [Candidatus Aenigmarchaeota archaeon]NIQ17666.1 thermosome subunit [Candidatus Aenigmarchaeota archaeon]NIS72854.1 thermosome subunit [Candidatus Aenigmarchaeota archaeon]
MGGQQVQPVFILPEGTLRTKGKEAQKNNIAAAKLVADAVRTTLGPKGMDKMLVDSLGDVTITNDGATILNEMQIEHPAAKMMAEVAKTQDEAVGDGTTTAVIIAGELLKEAEKLLEKQIHPTVITKGFRLAKLRALEILEKLSYEVAIKDEKSLKRIANTAMTGKSAERASEKLTDLAVRAVTRIADRKTNEMDTENIKIEKKQGGSMSDTELIEGIVLDKEVVHSGMPKKLEKVKVALLDSALEVKELEGDAKISIDSPEKLQAFLNEEEKSLKDMVNKVIKSGAGVVFCQKGIDDVAQHYLAKANILAARRVKKSDMEKLTRATGAKIVTSVKELSRNDLGYAGVVQEKKISGDEMIFVERCKDPKAVTILIRGGSEHVVDEVERAMEDAIKGVAAALELGKIVPGGGAVEIQVAKQLRKYAESFKGREQLAVNAFAEAMEIVPKSLAENAGLDPIDKLAQLRSEHDKKRTATGLDVFTGNVHSMMNLGVIEPLKIKLQALKSASEVAEMILRIDDMISAGAGEKQPPMPPGGMGGMPEY